MPIVDIAMGLVVELSCIACIDYSCTRYLYYLHIISNEVRLRPLQRTPYCFCQLSRIAYAIITLGPCDSKQPPPLELHNAATVVTLR